MRKAQGRQLAREAPVSADLVMPFPDSGTYAAIGYSEESGIPFELGMIRNHYVGRTFIQPTQSMRDFGVRVKLNPVRELLKGKEIIIVDDSIIRGTTVKTRVKALRELGVKRVHMRIAGPAHRFPCHYGIDFSTRGELIASGKSVEELRVLLDLDTLHYLSIPGLLASTGVPDAENMFCKACFDGVLPRPFRRRRFQGLPGKGLLITGRDHPPGPIQRLNRESERIIKRPHSVRSKIPAACCRDLQFSGRLALSAPPV